MLPKESLRLIAGVETQLKEPSFSFAGIHVWPVVRNTLMSSVLPVNKGAWPRKKRLSGTFRFLSSLRNLVSSTRFHTFFLTDAKYANLTSGRVYLKDIDAVSERHAEDAASILIGLQDLPEKGKSLPYKNTMSVFAITTISAMLSRAHPLMELHSGWRSFSSDLSAVLAATSDYPPKVHEKKMFRLLRKNVLFTVISSYFFSLLLGRVRPERCYIHCYYSLLGMALCAASHRAGIPVADIQHGISGRNMRAYASWSRVPDGGYNTMPDLFLTWTEYDQRAIVEWAGKVKEGPAAEVTGQLWLKSLQSSTAYKDALAEWAAFFGDLRVDGLRIVVTLQAPQLDPKIRKLIETSRQYIFLIRAHPDVPFESLPDELAILEERFGNVYVDSPTRMPIHVLMANSDLHITEWSASVYDALFSGIRSIVISPSGRDYFEDFIADDKVYYAPTTECLVARISHSSQRKGIGISSV